MKNIYLFLLIKFPKIGVYSSLLNVINDFPYIDRIIDTIEFRHILKARELGCNWDPENYYYAIYNKQKLKFLLENNFEYDINILLETKIKLCQEYLTEKLGLVFSSSEYNGSY